MRKLKFGSIGLVVLLVIALSIDFIIGSSKGVSWLSSQGDKAVSTTSANIEMYGYDGRSYSFTHPHDKSVECMAVATSEGVGLSCWNKPILPTK